MPSYPVTTTTKDNEMKRYITAAVVALTTAGSAHAFTADEQWDRSWGGLRGKTARYYAAGVATALDEQNSKYCKSTFNNGALDVRRVREMGHTDDAQRKAAWFGGYAMAYADPSYVDCKGIHATLANWELVTLTPMTPDVEEWLTNAIALENTDCHTDHIDLWMVLAARRRDYLVVTTAGGLDLELTYPVVSCDEIAEFGASLEVLER